MRDANRAKKDLADKQKEDLDKWNDHAWLSRDLIAHPGARRMTSSGTAGIGAAVIGVGESGDGEDNAGGCSFLNDEVQIIDDSLRLNGMTRADLTPQAFVCLLEQARRYALEIIADAQDYAYHSNRHDIQSSDLLLAVEMREDKSVATCLPPVNDLYGLAEEINRVPLPPIPTHCYNGVLLPPQEHQLTARTFDVVSSARVAQRMEKGGPLPTIASSVISTGGTSAGTSGAGTAPLHLTSEGGSGKRKRTASSYGANRGRQIAVNLKSMNTDTATSTLAVTNDGAATTIVAAGNAPSGVMPSSLITMATSGISTGLGGTSKRKADQI